ncbi:ABC transporter ATP-binding protein [Leptolyngbya cf. ectocarpi LEGE 11479]|uniref:ABC transporter ATP-binding protein n=1 Tax=Leptolyngbya cf. ectocarpi LEGE 11479 TaxID=1828722 RepID=A0A928X0B9_LEPEC|nr:ABC transporter ATP-binding protein [Leptolyngbya ectocarpi]MBE9066735.1 ABC transporter ATP-binding protein [Leptolyngbya cf. ectocarpi LEGE 11479]
MTSPLLLLDGFCVAYPRQSVWAVEQVSLSLQPGEMLGLVGESGCGKSTLGRAALRLLPGGSRTQGQSLFEGRDVFGFSPQEMRRFRGEAVSLVFQDPMTRLNPLMTIGNHCVETLQAHRTDLSKQAAKEIAIATLASVNIPATRWEQYPHEFSGGMRQRVAIALALLLNPKLIVADEPTTSLDVTVSAQILDLLTQLCRERGMALILISHDLALVGEYCDRIAVMYQSKLVELGPTQQVLYQPQADYTQSLLQAAHQLQNYEAAEMSQAEDTAAPLLRVQDLVKHYTIEQNLLSKLFNRTPPETIKAVDGISVELHPGEVLGLVGESGCGKSTFSRTLMQIIPPTSGRVEFMGQNLVGMSRSELQAQRRNFQMIFQDPHACLNPMMTVGRGIADPLIIHGLASVTEAKQQVHAMLQRVGLTPTDDYYQRYPSDLSGGQQQRVAIARALITQPKLVICDEPVSMLDASVQAQVLELMLELKDELELTYLFITHDLWVARYLCDRIAVMQAGKIVELGPTEQLFKTPQHPYTQTLLSAAPLLAP